jgi:hypothetical protein
MNDLLRNRRNELLAERKYYDGFYRWLCRVELRTEYGRRTKAEVKAKLDNLDAEIVEITNKIKEQQDG